MAKVPGAGIGAEAARGFLLELGHAKVAFGLVVVGGNAQVDEERKRRTSLRRSRSRRIRLQTGIV